MARKKTARKPRNAQKAPARGSAGKRTTGKQKGARGAKATGGSAAQRSTAKAGKSGAKSTARKVSGRPAKATSKNSAKGKTARDQRGRGKGSSGRTGPLKKTASRAAKPDRKSGKKPGKSTRPSKSARPAKGARPSKSARPAKKTRPAARSGPVRPGSKGKGRARPAAQKARGPAAKGRRKAAPAPPPPPEPLPSTTIPADDDLLPILEAMLFAAHEPLSIARMASSLGKVRRARVREALDILEEFLAERRSPLQLVEIAGGFRLVTRPEYAPYLSRLFHKAEKERLSPAALETLAIIAYHQPVTRADIEGIRGVQAGPVVRLLQDRKLVKVVGRAPVLGRPQQFGTTKRFLDHFALNALKDLPQVLGQDGRPVLAPGQRLPGMDGASKEAPEAKGAAEGDPTAVNGSESDGETPSEPANEGPEAGMDPAGSGVEAPEPGTGDDVADDGSLTVSEGTADPPTNGTPAPVDAEDSPVSHAAEEVAEPSAEEQGQRADASA